MLLPLPRRGVEDAGAAGVVVDGSGSSESTKVYPFTVGVEAPVKEASEADGGGRPAIASLTAEREGDGGTSDELFEVGDCGIRVLSYMTAFGGAAEASSFLWATVCVVSSIDWGTNMKGFSGREDHVSGIAFLVSAASIRASSFPFLLSSADFSSACKRSLLRCAIWRGAGILLPAHIQAYFSRFL